ncbi:MAG: hypothetical protein HWQ38_05845 [Nostoc sp. NMS7]|uniref:hypothetical protein n=1 Tax=Nostoc sp. NMS7 TaxID=2815391 RepID=UPI0025CF28DF|nr:hypothetical protein [Nostoc sp. NMS7]MBN3946021.1 hypothetical protein [Nostoc sp. NMS7]
MSRQELLLPNGLPNLLIQNFYSSLGEKTRIVQRLTAASYLLLGSISAIARGLKV